LKASSNQFFAKVKGIIEDMKTLSGNYIAEVGQEVTLFNEKFRDAAIQEQERLSAHANEVGTEAIYEEFEDNMEYLLILMTTFEEQEVFQTALEGFKETTEKRIGEYEFKINGAITTDWEQQKTTIEKGQHQRNRDIIKEIVTECRKFQEENAKKFQAWRDEDAEME